MQHATLTQGIAALRQHAARLQQHPSSSGLAMEAVVGELAILAEQLADDLSRLAQQEHAPFFDGDRAGQSGDGHSSSILDLLRTQLPGHIWSTDAELRMTSVLGSGLMRAGIDVHASVGQTLYDLIDAATHDTSPIIQAHRRALAGTPAVFAFSVGEHYFEARVEPLRDASGATIGCLGLALDITDRAHAEMKVQAQAQLLDLAYDAILVRAYPDGEVKFWSRGAADLYGWSAEAALGQVPHVLLQTRFPQPLPTILAELDATAQWQGELTQIARDGGQLVVLSRWALQHDEHGQPVAILEINRDITQRKAAEEAVRASEERLGRAIDQAPFPMCLHADDGEILLINAVWSDLTGYEPAELPTLTEWTRRAYGPAHQAVLSSIEQLYGSTERIHEGEFTIRTAFGTTCVWDFSSAALGSLPDGRRLALSMAVDITERKRMEQELAARLRQQAAVAQLGQRALSFVDPKPLLDEAVEVIAATLDVPLSGLMELQPAGDMLVLRAGHGWHASLVGAARVSADVSTQAGYALHSEQPIVVAELESETRFGGAPFMHEHGVVSGVTVIVHDLDRPYGVLGAYTKQARSFGQHDIHFLQAVANVLSAALRRASYEQQLARQRIAAERLKALDRLRQEFLGTVSHDLRTPLTAARAGLGMLESSADARLRPDERHLLGNVRRNIERLNSQIDDLIDLNQIEAGALQLLHEPIDLRAIAIEAVAAVHALMEQKKQTVAIDLPVPLPAVGDARRMGQVLVNVLANAYQHTPEGTQVTIAGHARGDTIQLAISDTGPGIPPEHHELIFARFHRLPTPTAGTGLGLAIARAITELHRGRMSLRSAPGAGACFIIELPRRNGKERHDD